MSIAAQSIEAFAQFVTSQPSLKEIATYHAPQEIADQVYTLLAAEKAGAISHDEQRELNHYETIEHILMCAKAEALHKLQSRAS